MKFPFYILLSMALLGLSSCAEMGRDMEIDGATDVQIRSGLTGTQEAPAVLDPFKRYDLVMAANECRYYTIEVPTGWYWKAYITAACRREASEGRVSAVIFPANPAWASLPGTSFEKNMTLRQDGDQALLAVGNGEPKRNAILRICQEGAPAYITIESQVSSTSSLLGPNDPSLQLGGHKNPLKDED